MTVKRIICLVFICLSFILLFNSTECQAVTYEGIKNNEKEMEIIPRGDPTTAMNNEKRARRHTSFEPTGLFLYQGESVEIIVDGNPENLEVRIGQWGGYNDVPYILNGTQMKAFTDGVFKLSAGSNIVRRDLSGGMIYLVNYSDSKTEKVTIKGGVKVPFYVEGETSVEEFKKQLETYKDVPFMEMVNAEAIATIRVERAKDIFAKDNQVKVFMDTLSHAKKLADDSAGLSMIGTGVERKANQRLHIMNPTFGAGLLFASDYYLGIHSSTTKDRTIFSSAGKFPDWGLIHEIGHTYQDINLIWKQMTEVSVNIHADYSQKYWSENSGGAYDASQSSNGHRKTVQNYFQKLSNDSTWNLDREMNETNSYHFVALGMFVTLPRVFGYEFYPILSQNYRSLTENEIPKTDLEKKQLFVILASITAKRNLLPFFDYWRFTITDETRQKIKELNLPTLEKEIYKDIFATEKEENEGTYRILGVLNPYTIPTGELGENIPAFPYEDSLNHVDYSGVFSSIYSEPIESKTMIKNIEITDNTVIGKNKAYAYLENDFGINNKLGIPIVITGGNSYVMSGQKGIYGILGYDSKNKTLISTGNTKKILENIPDTIYPRIRIYTEGMKCLKFEAVGYGKTTGVELSKQLNDQPVNIGDIIEVYHKEASKRVIRYNDDNKISTDKETYYYRIEKDRWVEVSDPTNQTSIHVKDSIVYSGDKWEAEDNFVSATDKDGNIVPFSTVTVTGTVDTTKPGVYEVTYANGERTKVALITVKENQESLNMKDSMLYLGDGWKAEDNFASATDKDGNVVPFSTVIVTGTVDTTKPGVYEVTYAYGEQTKIAVITVKENQESFIVKDSTLYVGDGWKAEDNFVSATDKDGNAVSFTDVIVTGVVDSSKAGVYQVTYGYSGVLYTSTITVIDNKGELIVKDSIVYSGGKWESEDNFVSAIDKEGNTVPFTMVTVTGTVDITKPGVYEVTYANGEQTKVAVITVKENQESLNMKDSMLYLRDGWKAEDNFVSATDKEGNLVPFTMVTVTGTVDITKLGVYEVTYTYGEQTKIAVITVKENQESLIMKDFTLYVRDGWKAEDNFVSATDKEGNLVPFTMVTVMGTVDTTKPGVYEVTYTYGEQTKIAVITVNENQESLVVKKNPPVLDLTTNPDTPVLLDPEYTPTTIKSKEKNTRSLPNTGMKQDRSMTIVGVSLLIVVAGIGKKIKRNRHKNHQG